MREAHAARWAIAMISGLSILVFKYIVNSFGIINNVYVAYFNLTYLEVDWFTLIQIPGDILCSLVVAFTIYINRTGFRVQLLLMTGFEIFTCVCLICSYVHPSLYPLIYISQFMMGIAHAMTMTMTTTLAVNWFPAQELGVALSIRTSSLGLGSLLAYLIPSHLLIPPNITTANSFLLTNETSRSWFVDNQKRFLVFSIPPLVLCVVMFMVEYFCVSEHPVSPSVHLESNERLVSEEFQKTISFTTFKNFGSEVLKVLKVKVAFLMVVIQTIQLSFFVVIVTFMSEIFRPIIVKQFGILRSNAMASYILVVFEVGYTIGSLSSGLIYDKLKQPNLQINVSAVCDLIALVGLLLGLYFESFITLMCFFGLFGLMFSLPTPAYYAILFGHTGPINEAFVVNLVKVQSYFGLLVIVEISRILLNTFGGIAVFIFITSLWMLVILCGLFVKPKNSFTGESRALLEN